MRTKNIFGLVDYATPTGLRNRIVVSLSNKGDIEKFRKIVLEVPSRLPIATGYDKYIIPEHTQIHLRKTHKTPSNVQVLAEDHMWEIKLVDIVYNCNNSNNSCEHSYFYTSVTLENISDEIDYIDIEEFEKDWVSRVFKDLNITENNDTSNTEEVSEEEECASVIKLKELKNDIDTVINKINLSNKENEYTSIAGVSNAIKVSSGVDISDIIQKLSSIKHDILGDTDETIKEESKDSISDAIRRILEREHIGKNLFGPRAGNTVTYIKMRENIYMTNIGMRIVNNSNTVLECICLTRDVTEPISNSFIGFYDINRCTITRCGNDTEYIDMSNKFKWSVVNMREILPLEHNGGSLDVDIVTLNIEAII